MIPMTLTEIAAVVGGTLATGTDGDLLVTAAAYVDSRRPEPGGLFVAVVGERVDGHDFASGAHAVLGSRPTAAPTVIVADPVASLGLLARHVVDRLVERTGLQVIALTGSQGKTGTKDYLAGALTVLAGEEAVVATAANNNNELGVPLTVLRAGPRTRYAVVEMGARGIGHIAYLCTIAPPRVAAVINVGSAHIGEFGSRDAIARAKGEILEALPAGAAGGVAVLNADDVLVAAMGPRTAAQPLTFSTGSTGSAAARDRAPDIVAEEIRLDGGGRPEFLLVHDGRRVPVALRQPGLHQVANAAAATALAVGAGVDFAAFAVALSQVEPASRWRMEVVERSDGLMVVNDAYNANPESMRAALEALAAIGAGGRRTVAVLGEMKELGAEHEAGHRAVGRAAVELGIDVVLVVGAAARGIHDAADGVAERILTADHAGAVAWLRQNAAAEDVVLVKASRGAALERVAAALVDQEETT